MGEARSGEEFIKHEFDESISIHEAIVDAETVLARTHPVPEARAAIAACLKVDQMFLDDLRRLGRAHGATGEVEDAAQGLIDLLESTVKQVDDNESDAYEAHAALLHAKRKQQDFGSGHGSHRAGTEGHGIARCSTGVRDRPEGELPAACGIVVTVRGQIATRAVAASPAA